MSDVAHAKRPDWRVAFGEGGLRANPSRPQLVARRLCVPLRLWLDCALDVCRGFSALASAISSLPSRNWPMASGR